MAFIFLPPIEAHTIVWVSLFIKYSREALKLENDRTNNIRPKADGYYCVGEDGEEIPMIINGELNPEAHNIRVKPPYLSITLNDKDAVPEVRINGELQTGLQFLKFGWATRLAERNRQATPFLDVQKIQGKKEDITINREVTGSSKELDWIIDELQDY